MLIVLVGVPASIIGAESAKPKTTGFLRITSTPHR